MKNASYEELNQRLNAIKTELNGTEKDISAETDKRASEYHAAFCDAMRTGILQNSLKEGSDGGGGYLVPDTYDSRLVQALAEVNVLRKISTVIKTTRKLKIPLALKDGAADWVIEGQPFSLSEGEFGQIEIDAFKVGTSILLSDELLEDSGFDLLAYIERTTSERIGDCEEEAFISGNGIGKPLGLINQIDVGAVSEKVGKLSVDDIIELYHSIRMPYRNNSIWLMSHDAYTALQKIKLYLGNQLIHPNNSNEGEPSGLFGRPVMISKYLDDIGPGSKPILFGNFEYYWIGDRGKRSIKRLNERYADYGQVGFQVSQRVDAKLVLPEAIKALEIRS